MRACAAVRRLVCLGGLVQVCRLALIVGAWPIVGAWLAAAAFGVTSLGVTTAMAQNPTRLDPLLGAKSAVSVGGLAPSFNKKANPFGPTPRVDKAQPLYLQGDELIYDNKGNRVTARGNVQIFYNNFVLQADEVVYDQRQNTLTAKGNVVLKDPNGGTTQSEQITLTDDFRDGFIDSLSVVAKDNTRIVARRGIRRGGNVMEFQDGKFTPCKTTDGMPPMWCISAAQIIHDQRKATISYKDAQFEFLGVPIAYLPYFQHPDPTVKRQSGILMPEFSHSEDLGFMSTVPYYFALAPNYDFTFHPMYSTRQGMLWQGDWRHRLAFGSIVGQYSVKFSAIDQDYTTLPNKDQALDGWRGSVHTKGEFSLASWWKFGWDVTIDSDDTFRRFYKLDSILQTDRINKIYLQGMSERNYLALTAYQFGGLLFTDTDNSESKVHPVLDWNYVVDGPVLGGELSWNVNAISFDRNLSFTDAFAVTRYGLNSNLNRASADINWRRRFIDRIGITYTPFANLRGDVASYDNVVDPVSNTLVDSETDTRGVASAGILTSYPWLAHTSTGSHVVEPIGQIIVRTAKVSQRQFPDEDARTLVFDDTNLFDVSKFSGYDRVETGTRANVGVQYTFQSNGGAYARILAGQSFHLSGTNPYTGYPGNEPSTDPATAPVLYSPTNGLETDRSDYVLGAYLAPSTLFKFIGQARFDERDLSVRRADALAQATYGPASFSAVYSYTDSASGLSTPDQDRQEAIGLLSLKLAEHWWASGSLRYDLTADQARQSAVALTYGDECFVLTATYIETYVSDPSRDLTPDRTIMLRFQLKHIGDFQYKTDALDTLATAH